jgi:hypothetical protein
VDSAGFKLKPESIASLVRVNCVMLLPSELARKISVGRVELLRVKMSVAPSLEILTSSLKPSGMIFVIWPPSTDIE